MLFLLYNVYYDGISLRFKNMNVAHDYASIALVYLKIAQNLSKIALNLLKNHALFFAIFQVISFAIFQVRTDHQHLDEALEKPFLK